MPADWLMTSTLCKLIHRPASEPASIHEGLARTNVLGLDSEFVFAAARRHRWPESSAAILYRHEQSCSRRSSGRAGPQRVARHEHVALIGFILLRHGMAPVSADASARCRRSMHAIPTQSGMTAFAQIVTLAPPGGRQ
jgi:hypothetical protein